MASIYLVPKLITFHPHKVQQQTMLVPYFKWFGLLAKHLIKTKILFSMFSSDFKRTSACTSKNVLIIFKYYSSIDYTLQKICSKSRMIAVLIEDNFYPRVTFFNWSLITPLYYGTRGRTSKNMNMWTKLNETATFKWNFCSELTMVFSYWSLLIRSND